MKTKWKNLFKELDYYETVKAGSSESFMKGREASPRDVIYDRVDILWRISSLRLLNTWDDNINII